MPYIVAAAVFDGYVRTDSFDPARVLDPARQRFLAEKVRVSAAPELGTLASGKLKRAQAGYLSRVEIETIDGRIAQGDAAPFPGHPKNPYSDTDLAEKLRENMRHFAGNPATEKLVAYLHSMDRSRASEISRHSSLLTSAPTAPGLLRNSNIGESA